MTKRTIWIVEGGPSTYYCSWTEAREAMLAFAEAGFSGMFLRSEELGDDDIRIVAEPQEMTTRWARGMARSA